MPAEDQITALFNSIPSLAGLFCLPCGIIQVLQHVLLQLIFGEEDKIDSRLPRATSRCLVLVLCKEGPTRQGCTAWCSSAVVRVQCDKPQICSFRAPLQSPRPCRELALTNHRAPGPGSQTATSHLRTPDRSLRVSCQERRRFMFRRLDAKNTGPPAPPAFPCIRRIPLNSPPLLARFTSSFPDPSPVKQTLPTASPPAIRHYHAHGPALPSKGPRSSFMSIAHKEPAPLTR